MKKTDDTEAKQAMLDALANYTGPITREMAKPETKTCKLSEFGECQREFVPAKKKKWNEAKFCCEAHRKRYHYLERNGTTARRVNGETNGHDVAQAKLTLARLGLAQPKPAFKRRKLSKPSESEIAERASAKQDARA